MNCSICLDPPDKNIPLLICGHYVCCECYCRLKNMGFTNCLDCNRVLRRGRKKNKLIKKV